MEMEHVFMSVLVTSSLALTVLFAVYEISE